MAVQRDYFGFAKCFAILFGREEVPFFINSDPKKNILPSAHRHIPIACIKTNIYTRDPNSYLY